MKACLECGKELKTIWLNDLLDIDEYLYRTKFYHCIDTHCNRYGLLSITGLDLGEEKNENT